jgi:hypothetical protein
LSNGKYIPKFDTDLLDSDGMIDTGKLVDKFNKYFVNFYQTYVEPNKGPFDGLTYGTDGYKDRLYSLMFAQMMFGNFGASTPIEQSSDLFIK